MKKTERRIVQIDITDLYERLKRKSAEEIRSIEEQCKFFIKKGLGSIDTTSCIITYQPQPRLRDDWNTDYNRKIQTDHWDYDTVKSSSSSSPETYYVNSTEANGSNATVFDSSAVKP